MKTIKGDTLKVRMDGETLAMLDAARAYLKLDKSKFIRESVREKAAAVIAEHERTRFTAEDWQSFFAALERPALSTARMRKAVEKFRDISA
jgi:uncharacterized protein (DUF1778 family)